MALISISNAAEEKQQIPRVGEEAGPDVVHCDHRVRRLTCHALVHETREKPGSKAWGLGKCWIKQPWPWGRNSFPGPNRFLPTVFLKADLSLNLSFLISCMKTKQYCPPRRTIVSLSMIITANIFRELIVLKNAVSNDCGYGYYYDSKINH